MQKKTKIRKSLTILLLGVLCFALVDCHLVQNSSPSVLVIAVDHLGVNQLNCSADASTQVRSGLALLCQDSIRFTHAYTTSPLSGPALTSVLTAQYPFEHGLRSNTKSFLPSRVTTLPELAQQKNYATSFFSGGAPVLRKLNLQQGFETFDDSFSPTPNRLFRSFSRTSRIFETWLNEIGRQNFFTVFYVPDIAFVNTPTQTLLGENRNLSTESQLEQFDESLFDFIQILKSRRIWDSTLIILVGLNGPADEGRESELSNLNLFSERTQVGLLIKPAQKPRDQGINWSFDANVTLADVGATIGEVFGYLPNQTIFPVVSLAETLKSPSPKLAMDRPVLSESSWDGVETPRYAIRWGQYLFLLDARPLVYNSLIDRLETTPIRASETNALKEWQQIQSILTTMDWALWPQIRHDEFLKWKGLSDLWSMDPSASKTVSFERLAHRLRDNAEVTELYSRELLNQQSWPELEKWAQGLKLPDLEKVALRNLKKDSRRKFQDPCLAALDSSQPSTLELKKCDDPVALTLIEWVLLDKKESGENTLKEALRKRFLRQFNTLRLDRKIVETNYALEDVWDLSPRLKKKHLAVEMMLSLPEMQKYRQIALKSFQQIKED